MDDSFIYFRRHDICPHCRENYTVKGRIQGGNIVAWCLGCHRNVDRNDHRRYLRHFHRTSISRSHRTKRYDATKLSEVQIARISRGGCVHCAIEALHGTPRRVEIPMSWASPVPPAQLLIFSESPLSELLRGEVYNARRSEHDDHLIPHSIFKRIERSLNDFQRRAAETRWKVPSCQQHNNDRRERIEFLEYLLHAFALLLAANGINIEEQVVEVNAFADAVRLAHVHIALEKQFRRREEERAG